VQRAPLLHTMPVQSVLQDQLLQLQPVAQLQLVVPQSAVHWQPAPHTERMEHEPLAQLSPAMHALPHAPQCRRSVASSVSHPLESVVSQSSQPGSHVPTRQKPLRQPWVVTWARSQTDPHPPQFVTSLLVLVSQPSVATPLQSSVPAKQVPMPHVAAAQVCVATDGRLHRFPHPPQWSRSAFVLISQPVAAFASQSARPLAHAPMPQAPSTQVWVATSRSPQTSPHSPQLSTSLEVASSQPFAIAPSQSSKPAVQAWMSQTPVAHSGVLFGGLHAASHAPQCARSAARSTQLVPQSVNPGSH
jgi:hypothetical protein